MSEAIEVISKESLDLLLTRVSEQQKEIAALQREVEELKAENKQLRKLNKVLVGGLESLCRELAWCMQRMPDPFDPQELEKAAAELMKYGEAEQLARESING